MLSTSVTHEPSGVDRVDRKNLIHMDVWILAHKEGPGCFLSTSSATLEFCHPTSPSEDLKRNLEYLKQMRDNDSLKIKICKQR